MEQAIFALTFVVTVYCTFDFTAIIFGHKITFPHIGILDPTAWIFAYPSALYQAWFWSERLVFNS